MAETLPEWIWQTDTDLRFTYVSPHCADVLKRPPEELTGRRLSEMMSKAQAAKLDALAAALKKAPLPLIAHRAEVRDSAGRTVAVEINAAPFFDREGALQGFRGVIHDVTARDQVERRLRQGTERLQDVIRSTADYVWEVDRRGSIRSLTGREGEVLGYAPEALIGKRIDELGPETDRAELRRRMKARLKARSSFLAMEINLLQRDGRTVTLEINGAPLFTPEGRFDGFQGGARDISQRKSAERALTYRDRILDAIARAAAELVGAAALETGMPRALEIIGDALGADRALVIRKAADTPLKLELLFVWERPELPSTIKAGGVLSTFADPASINEWLAPLSEGRPAVASIATAKGALAMVLNSVQAKSILLVPIMVEARWWGQIGIDDCGCDTLQIFADLVGASILRERHEGERKRAEAELQMRARIDPLTGLANRLAFEERLADAQAAQGDDGGFAVHHLDLDHFKDINDTLGHPLGDRLLKAVAERLRRVTRHKDLVARFGGDEFAVLQTDVDDPEVAGVLADKLLREIRQPFLIDGHEIHVGASVGIAVCEPDAPDPEVLLSHAELALYRAKSEGRQTYRFFTGSMDAETRARVSLTDQLRRGIDAGQFFLEYQPQVSMEDGRLIGLEALIRWRHPERGLVAPTEFIPAAEHSGLIIDLGRWILREACLQTKRWLDAGLDCPPVAVNMSAIQLRRPAEAERELAAILREVKLPRGILQLELTETTLMEAAQAQIDVLERLHADGLRISLDDFGTGYSSLDYLRRYPVDQIKIAQVFVAGIAENPGDAAIVKAAISLARELNLQILAEGVETIEQVRLLLAWGCRAAQGYYYAKPMAPDDIAELLRRSYVGERPARAS
jgi:diguanylate cyclase (GGDEF)-like protein/PAS domain S-box-containing protein